MKLSKIMKYPLIRGRNLNHRKRKEQWRIMKKLDDHITISEEYFEEDVNHEKD